MVGESEDLSAAEVVAHHLLAIHRHLRRYTKAMSAELGITGRQLAALQHLAAVGPLSVGQISAYLYVADSTTSEMLDGLVERGLISRSRSNEDNRVAVVALTPAGRDLVARAPLGGMRLLRERLSSEPPERLVALARALEDLGRLMEVDEFKPR